MHDGSPMLDTTRQRPQRSVERVDSRQLALPLRDAPAAHPQVSSRKAEKRSLRAVGLFAGIGGIERALASAGHETLMMCEIDRTARAVLEHRFPNVQVHDDVCTLERLPEGTELVAGGFPCQDLSQAGKTAGIGGARSGLIMEVFRLAADRKVPWLLLENVPFMLQLSGGRALDVIMAELERLGYKWAYRVVDARAFGLPQRRERVFIVASLDDDPRRILFADDAGTPTEPERKKGTACGFYWTEGVRGLGWAVDAVPTLKGGSTVGVPSPPAILLPNGHIVTPSLQDAERMQGFPKDWTKAGETVSKRGMRWKLVGNAVNVPTVKWIADRLAKPGKVLDRPFAPIRHEGKWPRAAFNVGTGRYSIDISAWPKHAARSTLLEFIGDRGTPLSRRATAGFLNRTEKASLRFPEGFLDAVRAHLRRMEALEGT